MRKANKEGSSYKNARGKYVVQITIGYNASGDIVRKSRTCNTHTDARRALREMQDMYAATPNVDENLTFGDWARKCVDDYVEPSVRFSTLRQYRCVLKLIENREINKVKLVKLREIHFQNFVNSLNMNGASKRQTYSKIQHIMKYAVQNRILPINPAISLKIPSPRQQRCFDLDIQKMLTALVDIPVIQMAAKLMLFTGMRRGEVCALTWADYDKARKILRVDKQIARTSSGMAVVPPKSDKSVRNICIPDILCNELNNYRVSLMALHKNILHDNGSFLDPDSLTHRMVRRTGVTPHQLRHYFASHLIRHGINFKIVQDTLGHSNFTTTMNTYAHVSDEDRIKAAEVAASIK